MAIIDVGSNGNLAGLSKTFYPQKEIKRVCYPDMPLFAMLRKREDMKGDPMNISMRISHGNGSSLFSEAQAGAGALTYKAFQIRAHEEYAVRRISTRAIRLCNGDKGAIVDLVKEVTESAVSTASKRIAHGLYGNGGGAIGVVDAGGAGAPTLTLASPTDIVNFYVGQRLDGSTDDGTTGTVIAGGVGAVVSAIDRDTGTITATGVDWDDATAINGLAAGDYLFPRGDFGIRLKGLGAWIPEDAPTSGDDFYDVDRSIDSALSGNRVSAQATIQESLQFGMERVFREGDGGLTDYFLSPSDHNRLSISLGDKVQYVNRKSPDMPEIGFDGIVVVGAGGKAVVHADPYCPVGVAYGLKMPSCTLWSAGETIGHLMDSKMLTMSSEDAVELRIGGYLALVLDQPWACVRVALPG